MINQNELEFLNRFKHTREHRIEIITLESQIMYFEFRVNK